LSLDLDPLLLGFFHYILFNFTNVAIAIIASLLNDRSFHVSINEINSGTDTIPYGVPQEAILSQYLYNFFTADFRVQFERILYINFIHIESKNLV
jgi:hypothetical protein